LRRRIKRKYKKQTQGLKQQAAQRVTGSHGALFFPLP